MMKKIGALVLAVMMIAVVGVAFATGTPNSNHTGDGEGDEKLAVLSDANEFVITKDIVLYNAEGSQIYAPNITYSYRVQPAGTTANNVEITGIKLDDQASPFETTTVTVKNGIAGGVLLANAEGGTGAATTTITFENGNTLDSATPLTEDTAATTSNATAAKTSKNIYVQIVPSVIYNNGANTAGIYRYAITDETTRDTLAAAGILRNDSYDASYKTLYLDVYLKNKIENNVVTGLEVYGYVLFKSGTADTEFEYSASATEAYKLTGFNVASEQDGTNVISDQYHTYNLEVTKTTTGALADKGNYFPFDITITEAGQNTTTKVYVTHSNAQNVRDSADNGISSASGATLAAGGTATTFKGGLKDGGTVKFTGIPSYITYSTSGTTPTYSSTTYATANADETNNTYDTYSATATVDGETSTNVQLTYKTTQTASEADTAATAHAAVLSNTGDAKLKTALTVDGKNSSDTVVKNVIAFTNTLDAISPTGVVLRFAPYALMLGAGIVLLILAHKRRNTAEEA